jgi:hypothetical protein
MLPLREAIAQWIGRRHGVPVPDPATQVLPVAGSREALFAFAQTVVTETRRDSAVESEAYAGAWRAYHRALLDAGIFIGGKPLDAPETATTVRLRESKREIQDGPYSNTKEQLGGFTLLELPSLDAALEWAARCPAASYGTVEVRPIAVELEPRVTVADSN